MSKFFISSRCFKLVSLIIPLSLIIKVSLLLSVMVNNNKFVYVLFISFQLNKVHELAEQIGKKLAQAEKLGAEGNVEESMKTLEEVEEFRKQKALAEVN